MVGTKTSGRREKKKSHAIKSSHIWKTAVHRNLGVQIMRKSVPGSWKHMLNSGGWETTSAQAESTGDTDPRSDPTVLFTRGLYRNLPATSHDVSTERSWQAWHQEKVVQGLCQLWPCPPSVTSMDSLMGAGHYCWANTPFPNQQSSAEDLNGSQQFPVLADWADIEPELSQTRGSRAHITSHVSQQTLTDRSSDCNSNYQGLDSELWTPTLSQTLSSATDFCCNPAKGQSSSENPGVILPAVGRAAF